MRPSQASGICSEAVLCRGPPLLPSPQAASPAVTTWPHGCSSLRSPSRMYWVQCALHCLVPMLALSGVGTTNPCHAAPRCEDPPSLPPDVRGVAPQLFPYESPAGPVRHPATSSIRPFPRLGTVPRSPGQHHAAPLPVPPDPGPRGTRGTDGVYLPRSCPGSCTRKCPGSTRARCRCCRIRRLVTAAASAVALSLTRIQPSAPPPQPQHCVRGVGVGGGAVVVAAPHDFQNVSARERWDPNVLWTGHRLTKVKN